MNAGWLEERKKPDSRLSWLPRDLVEYYLKPMMVLRAYEGKWLTDKFDVPGGRCTLGSDGEVILPLDNHVVKYDLQTNVQVLLSRHKIRIYRILPNNQLLWYSVERKEFTIYDLTTQSQMATWELPTEYSCFDLSVSGDQLILQLESNNHANCIIVQTSPFVFEPTVLSTNAKQMVLIQYSYPVLVLHRSSSSFIFRLTQRFGLTTYQEINDQTVTAYSVTSTGRSLLICRTAENSLILQVYPPDKYRLCRTVPPEAEVLLPFSPDRHLKITTNDQDILIYDSEKYVHIR